MPPLGLPPPGISVAFRGELWIFSGTTHYTYQREAIDEKKICKILQQINLLTGQKFTNTTTANANYKYTTTTNVSLQSAHWLLIQINSFFVNIISPE